MRLRIMFSVITLSLLVAFPVYGQSPVPQPAEMIYNEAQAVHLGNLARRAHGVAPLRWNLQLTDAARWFAWDSVENRPEPYCGHQDTQGKWPSDRIVIFGYKGFGGAENAFCGYVTPQQAIDGWMNSPGHRANLLDPNSREIGLGYYRRASDGRGYVVQDFGVDAVCPPVIIENEAINTTLPTVNLYIYNRASGGGFAEMGPATQMMISNDPCFSGADWEAYQAEKSWALASGEGWRTVYVKTRDVFNRSVTVSDVIYLGANVPLNELGSAQMSTTRPQVTLYNLNGGGLPQVQFSLGWMADDTFGTFGLLWGIGERVSDSTALGGTAFRLGPPDGYSETSAWVWTTEFIKNVPLVAYFRLKVSDNTSVDNVARVSVKGGGTEYGPLVLRGVDFRAANQYQEFPLPFTYQDTSDAFLIFQFWRDGTADVYVDAVTIFTAPQPLRSTMTWDVPGGNYRGQGIWVRYTDGRNQFSALSEASTILPSLSVSPTSLGFHALRGGPRPTPAILNVRQTCGSFDWQVQSSAIWLQPQASGDSVIVNVDQTGLGNGTYQGTLTISAVGMSDILPISVPVSLIVADNIFLTHIPIIRK